MTAKNGNKGHILRILILLALVVAIVSLQAEHNLSRMMVDMASAQAYSIAVETMNQAVWDVLKGGVRYDELIITHKDEAGKVTMLSANTMLMSELATQTALTAEKRLSNSENEMIEIPLGAALGVRFLAGAGPRVKVQIVPVGSVSTRFETAFESAGINQTRHKIAMTLSTTVQLVIPSGAKRIEVESTVPIAESIIVGEVPDSFVDVANQEDMINLIP